jgi:hypothetical protein
MVNRLTFHNQWADKPVNAEQFGFGDVSPCAGFNQGFTVSRVSLFMEIILFQSNAPAFLHAAVTSIRRLKEAQANLFFIVGANFITFAAGRAFPCAVGLIRTKTALITLPAFHAAVMRQIRCIFVRIFSMLSNFP